MSNTASPAAGWYPDPAGDGLERWWNGLAWTSTTRVPAATLAQTLVLPPLPVGAAGAPAGPYAASAGPSGAAATPPNPYGTVPPFRAVAPYAPDRRAVQPAYGGAYGFGAGRQYAAPPVSTMGQAVRAVFTRYATFEGRASRSEYWYWALFNAIISVGAVFVMLFGLFTGVFAVLSIAIYLGLIAWSLAIFVPTLAVSVRRLRDAGQPWPLIFLSLAPFGSIVLLVLHCQPSRD